MDTQEDQLVNAFSHAFDEIPSKKQLLLRQQKDKPLLKSSSSEPGPIYLYQNVDLNSKAVPTSAPSSPAKKAISTSTSGHIPLTSYTSGQYNYVPSLDPYSRPLSAKEILTVGADQARNTKSPVTNSLHATQIYNNQMFRLLRSADSTSSGRPSHRTESPMVGTQPIIDDVINSSHITTTKVVSIQSESTLSSTQTAKLKFEASLSKPPLAPERGARPPSSLRMPISAAVRNPDYSPSRPYRECPSPGPVQATLESRSQPGLKVENNLNNTINKAITALSKPSVNRNTGTNVPSKMVPSTVPNIKDVNCVNNADGEVSSRKDIGRSAASNETPAREESGSEQENQTGTADVMLYYLKSYKPELRISLPEQRPKCEGQDSVAPSVECSKSPQEVDGDHSEQDDEEDAEEEHSTPSLCERSSGDGEAFDDFDDEEGLDNMDDDELEGPDGEEDDYSSGSTSQRTRSASVGRARLYPGGDYIIRMKSARGRSHSSYVEHNIQPALIKSLFAFVPPCINFVGESEKVEPLPWEYRKLLKWRMCSITPNIVKHTIERSGFRPTKKHYDWLGCWGKHMKAQGFKVIREYQKLNHFPGSFQIGRKDRLWRNLSKMQIQFGKKDYNFFPLTFVLPADMKQLKRAWEDAGLKQKWIMKPPASARGIGIKVINKWGQIPKKRSVVIQKYLSSPLLINDSKFDCRIYVYVSSYDPLRIYVYEDGLVRFCSVKYSNSMKHINNKYMHLTNYSINKKNQDYKSNTDDTVCQGHKWSLKSLWGYLLKKGVNTGEIWKNIKDLIVKTIISAESPINSMIKSNVKSRYSVHELFGFDILLDETYKPWVLEVNISPSLHSTSQLDINIKGMMIKDLHNLAGFRIPDRVDVVPNPSIESYKVGEPSSRHCADKRLISQTLSVDEKAKHAYYCQRHTDEAVLATITDILTPDDIRILIESIDEDSRKGGFQRVFPTPSTNKYLQFFESARYYNLFLDQWVQKYNRMEARGIALIEAACKNKIHLQNPTDDPRHQWCPPMRVSSSSTQLVSNTNSFNQNLPKLQKRSPGDKTQISRASARPPLPPSRQKTSIAPS